MAELVALAALAFLIGFALRLLLMDRRKEAPEFDGGFRHNHPRVTTTIYYGQRPIIIKTEGEQ